MKNKDKIITEAALAQFVRFGLRKTTMQDVADAAQISRQTLYNHVANKDALLQLVARIYSADNLHRCQMALREAGDFSQALDNLITFFVMEPWQTIHAMPEADDFEVVANDIIVDEIREATINKIALISDTICRYHPDTQMSEAEAIARLFCATAAGMKSAAETQEALIGLCHTMKQSILAVVTTSQQAA